MAQPIIVTLTVNGEPISRAVEPRLMLADFLREELGLKGTHVGCEHGVCGVCTLRLDGVMVRGCLTLAVQCEGAAVETIEGITERGVLKDLQEEFVARNALQCGFCTPGILMSAAELLKRDSTPSREEIRDHLSGNYCRCTGYQSIVDAVETTARRRGGKGQ